MAVSANSLAPTGTGIGALAIRLVHGLYFVYVLGTIGGAVIAYFTLDVGIRDVWIARTIFFSAGVLLVVMLIFLVWFAVHYSRKARYSEILTNLHEIHHALRDLQSEINSFPRGAQQEHNVREMYRRTVEEGFQRVLTQVVVAFSVASGVSCRAAIKLVGLVNDGESDKLENLYVRTLARDVTSAHACAEKDRIDDKTHLITKNTDFELLVKGVRRYYFSSNVNIQDDYLNSSLEYWTKNRPFAALVQKRVPWLRGFLVHTSLYPYTSVMTFPVRGAHVDGAERGMMGFLCVDTTARSAFLERYDPGLGASIADALYHPLREYGLQMVNSRKK